MAFDDGTPLDAAALQALQTKINILEARVPEVKSSVTNVQNVTNNNTTIVQSQIIGGISEAETLVPGGIKTFNISFGKNVSATPIAISLTPAKSTNEPSGAISYSVRLPLKADGCTVDVYQEAGTKPFSMKFSWIVLVAS